jgi:hypothetical protein
LNKAMNNSTEIWTNSSLRGWTLSRARVANQFFLFLTVGIFFSLVGCVSRRAIPVDEVVVGRSLPTFEGEALDGRRVLFPNAIKGQVHLLLVAYVQEAQFDVDRWVLGALQAKAPVRILELPTIESLGARLAKGFINRGMQRGIPREDWASVVTVYEQAETVASFVGGIPGNNTAALLVDASGVVRWAHRKGYSPRELMEMMTVVDGLP